MLQMLYILPMAAKSAFLAITTNDRKTIKGYKDSKSRLGSNKNLSAMLPSSGWGQGRQRGQRWPKTFNYGPTRKNPKSKPFNFFKSKVLG